MKKNETHVLFQTIKESNVVILRQPFTVVERVASGKTKGQVKRRRKAQYCEDLESIYVDEQKQVEDSPIVTSQYFKKRSLLVENENIALLECLRLHEDNVANGGTSFKEVNVTQEEVNQIQALRELDTIRTYIMLAEEDNVRTMGLFYLGHSSLSQSIQGIKLKLREKVETNLIFRNALIKYQNEGNKTEKTIVTIALAKDVVKLYGKDFLWSDSNESIYISPQVTDAVNSFSNWLVNDEVGRQIYSALVDKVEAANK
jgi:hypothetical protein